ncbi:MAG: hypothetical protein QM736_12240 [Vicinamibacterales bacterium]
MRSAPRRIAKMLNDVDTTVNATDALMLTSSSGVPLATCTASSSPCESSGSAMVAAIIAFHSSSICPSCWVSPP